MKRIKYLLIFVVSILFVSANAYSQSVEEAPVKEEQIEKKSDDPVNYSEEAPVFTEDGGETVIKVDPTEKVEIKTEQPTEEEIRKEAGYESETETNSSETETTSVKKKHKKKKHQGENGKSESRGNKDKNNDSPYDHDQGKGNDWKADPRIDKNDKKDQNYDNERAPDSTKKEKKEKKNIKSKINKKNK